MSEKKSVYRIFSINPGSTSTKVAVFDNTKLVASKTDRYEKSELAKFNRILDQSEFRLNQIISWLDEQGIALESIDAFVGRGGILKPMESGVYEVNDTMLADLHVGRAALHASALGGIFAYELGRKYSKPAYIVDPVVVDERPMIAKVSGIPGTERGCVFHALNQRSVAHHYAEEHGKKYEDCCLLVAHSLTLQSFVQTKIRHHRRNNRIIAQFSLLLHIFSTDIHDEIAINGLTLMVYCNTAVRITIKGKSYIQTIFLYKLL